MAVVQKDGGDENAPTRSLDKQVVLEEDEYTEALSKIIARDFFPSLVHLEANNDYLDALQSEDQARINASVRRLSQFSATPAFYTPANFSTPRGEHGIDTPLPSRPSKRARYDHSLSLDDFQARYTSEDNSSFTQILDDENKKRRERWKWAWEAQKRVEEAKKKQLEVRDRLMIQSHQTPGFRGRLAIEKPDVAGLLTDVEQSPPREECALSLADEDQIQDNTQEDSGPESSAVVLLGTGRYGDSESSIKDALARPKDERPAGVDGWEFKARNNLMYPPDADQSPHGTSGQDPGERSVKHNNTRFTNQIQEDSASEPPTPSHSLVQAAITGTPYHPRSPGVSGYTLVPDLPSPKPHDLGTSGLKKLMTTGQLSSTPRVLPRDDGIPLDTPFHLPQPTQREQVARRLSTTASRSLKERAALMTGTPRMRRPMDPPSMTPRRLPSELTPAAKRLLDRTMVGNVASSRRGEAMSKLSGWERSARNRQDFSRLSWTPTPKR